MSCANPGSTKPVLRPDAFQATRHASNRATDQPRRASSRAAVSPASPPPTTQISTSRSAARGGRSGAGTIVSVYQLGAYAGRSDAFTLFSRDCGPPSPCRAMLDRRVTEIDAFAMRLLLLRHAKAEKAEGGTPDRDRPLNARGRKDAPSIGAYMAHHALSPERAVVSDSRRTRETWERLATVLPAAPPVTYEDALYHATPEAIVNIIRDSTRSARTLLLVGHNPG